AAGAHAFPVLAVLAAHGSWLELPAEKDLLESEPVLTRRRPGGRRRLDRQDHLRESGEDLDLAGRSRIIPLSGSGLCRTSDPSVGSYRPTARDPAPGRTSPRIHLPRAMGAT